METRIRKATLQDYDGLCAAIDQVDRLHREKLPGFYRKAPDGSVRSREYIQAMLEDPDRNLLVAEENGQILGALEAVVRDTPPVPILVPRRYAVIDNLVVLEGWRGRGIASALIARAEEWAREAGAETVELNVYLFNHGAIHLYEELGFAGISQRMIKRLASGESE